MSEPRLFCTFYLGDDRFGLGVEEVHEVIRHGEPSSVPLAPAGIVGLINLRGKIATVVDLAERLGRPRAIVRSRNLGLVLRNDESVVSLLIDRIGDVVPVTDEQFEPPPETLKGTARQLIRGTYKLDDGLLLSLDRARAVPDLREMD